MPKLLDQKVIDVLDGEECRRLRLGAKKTLKEVAGDANISVSYLCDIERGNRTATGSVARAIAKALK